MFLAIRPRNFSLRGWEKINGFVNETTKLRVEGVGTTLMVFMGES